MNTVDPDTRCPCTSGLAFVDCCGPIVGGDRVAPTASALMRSRFTAFAIGDRDHLLRTWHARTRPDELELDDSIAWYRLDVESAVAGGPFDTEGQVGFSAYYRVDGRRARLSELSRFVREGGQWYYVDGDVD